MSFKPCGCLACLAAFAFQAVLHYLGALIGPWLRYLLMVYSMVWLNICYIALIVLGSPLDEWATPFDNAARLTGAALILINIFHIVLYVKHITSN